MKVWNDLYETVISKDLCTSCGTCIGVCPKNIIKFDKNEKIVCDSEKCISCSKCVKACPGKDFDYVKYNEEVFNISYKEEHRDLGHFMDIKKGYSNNIDIRNSSSSGGIVSETLAYLIDEKLIDGAICILPKDDNKFQYESKIIRTYEELLLSTKSKYTLVPTNEVIKELLKLDGRYAYVGLPCQVQGIRKAMHYDNRLKDKIHICIGIFCGFNMSNKATEYLINKSKIDKNNIVKIDYRAKKEKKTGFQILGVNGEEFFVSKHEYTILNIFYSPRRCWKCYDFSAEFADISVGDAWEEELGCSRIIIRNDNAKNIIKDMKRLERIEISDSSKDDIVLTQKQLLSYKKEEIFIRKKFSRQFPENNIMNAKLGLGLKIRALIFYISLNIGSTKLGKVILKLLPLKFIGGISILLRNVLKRI